MSLEVVKWPNNSLRVQCKEVTEITDEIKALAAEMINTMYDNKGIGLAATQVGKDIRLIVADVPESKKLKKVIMINPKFLKLKTQDPYIHDEGCLSVPGGYIEKRRAYQCVVEFMDLEGKKQKLYLKGLDSAVIQHEVNHLDGKLITDR